MSQPIAESKFIGASESSGRIVVKFYNDFDRLFNHELPDERGLTDMFLLNMSTSIRESGLADPVFKARQISQYQEGKLGYDYAWEFRVTRKNNNVVQDYNCLLQAKNFKNGVANFMYKNSKNEYQMDILKREYDVQVAANPNAKVRGGYILYGPKAVQFIDIEEVLSLRKSQAGKKDPDIDRYISDAVFNSSGYFMASILD